MTATLVSLRKYWRVFASIIALLAVVVSYSIVNDPASATHQPADKVAAAGANITPVSSDQTILTANLKTSAPTDLILQVTLECSINTALITDVSGEHQEASATVKVWVTVDDVIVPIKSVDPSKTSPQVGEEKDKVTFCNRTYGRTVTDQDGNETIDSEDDFIATKTTHAFNWLRLNLGRGPHEIEVVADFDTTATARASATAQVGNRTLIVQPAKLANDATI